MPGRMRDIVSNALTRGLEVDESTVREFLEGAQNRYSTGAELLAASANHFGAPVSTLQKQVNAFQHVNCKHGPVGGEDNGIRDSWDGTEAAGELLEASAFARNVILHVVLHELGHALVREFDLPILGNEETLADAFATHYLTTYLPERAEAALLARVQSLSIEASEVPRQEWTVAGEHNSDARRAFQIAALSVAADPAKYAAVAEAAGMTADDVRRASDYGTEVHRSWRRVLAPLWMPAGQPSGEARLRHEGTPLFSSLLDEGLGDDLWAVVRGIDWHSQVTIDFRQGEGGAGWSRSLRTITVRSEYVRRFVEQGKLLESRSEAGQR